MDNGNEVFESSRYAAALALMIPLSAYAAEAEQVNSSSAAVPDAIDSGTDLPVQTQTDAGGGHFGHHGHGGMGGLIGQEVLTLLKLDQDALRQKLKEGQTLAQIAKGQGVSRDELKKVLTETFAKNRMRKSSGSRVI